MKKWTRAFYQPNLPLKQGKYVTASPEHIALSKDAAKEGMVLLKNKDHVLPLKKGSKVALFGKGTFDYVKGGGGSGDVTVSYVRNIYEGLSLQEGVSVYEPLADFYRNEMEIQYAAGAAKGMTREPALPEKLTADAAKFTDTAIISISRFSGEGWDRSGVECNNEFNPWESETSMPKTAEQIFPKGDFYLTAEEEAMMEQVLTSFDKVIVLMNVGGIVDTNWIFDERISSVLLTWQGGMEGGLAAAELLCGKGNPSGKLPDTFAKELEDYPSVAGFHESFDYVNYEEDIYVGYRYFETIPGKKDRVNFPFGFGLSYTEFDVEHVKTWHADGNIFSRLSVTNIGAYAGKEVVSLYAEAPQGLLKKPARSLLAFEKTRELLPGECQVVTLSFKVEDMASFDDLGKIKASAYVLEKGDYRFYVGTNVRDAADTGFVFTLKEDEITKELTSLVAPRNLAKRMLSDGSFEDLPQKTPLDLNESVIEKMVPGTEEGLAPAERARDRYLLMNRVKPGVHPLMDVAENKISLDEFIAQLSDEDLIHLLGGQPNTGVSNTYGFGNMPEYGIPNITTADGPAGLRIGEECGVYTTAWPCSTLLASTWNQELIEEVGAAGAAEVKENNISAWLTPAVCIHRSPLCGRNFEYYSEDPFLSGKMGAAMVRGIQSENVAAAVKHFAANNKEVNRKHSDSRVSERALREIYLKQFEIIVKESDPWIIMSAYNAINGQRASESKELLEGILRDEWNFKGMVTSDWWTRGEQYKEILAGNDVKMGCGFPERVAAAAEKGAINRADYEHCAKRVLELILKID